ncbi:MAG: histidine kinase [Chloroflexi bacterium]|nr:histidine kinase [Chloroflexota bacterium]
MSERELSEEEVARRVAELEARVEDLRRRLPAHSVPPALLIELEELEEELEAARARMRKAKP